jgi:hypothetical protein
VPDDPCERLRLGEWTLADWRRSYAPGGNVFWLPVLKAGNECAWRDGRLLSVDGFVISAQFDDQPTPGRLGTLWPDRLSETVAGPLARDEAGRPRIRYCEAYAIFKLVPEDVTSGWPCFNVANLDGHPEYLEAWVEHARSEQLFDFRSGPRYLGQPTLAHPSGHEGSGGEGVVSGWQIWRWTLGPDFNETGGFFRELNGHFEWWDGKRIGWTPITGGGSFGAIVYDGNPTGDRISDEEFHRLAD